MTSTDERLERIEKTLYIDNGDKSMQTKIQMISDSQERIETELGTMYGFFRKVAISLVTALIVAVIINMVQWRVTTAEDSVVSHSLKTVSIP